MKSSRKKSQSNIEFVTELMEQSEHGALAQLFVIECLTKWSQTVINNEAELLKSMEHGFLSGEAWVSTAREINAKIEARYAAQSGR